ncbi:MAG: recombinase RecF, partial [Thermodesulfobacteriota bacterium]|nr:recombinase RecF [Thermodesulfobacteriota bacterium]
MSDKRLKDLVVKEPKALYGNAVRINTIKFKNYKFFHGNFDLPVNGKNILVYGENGSGKSSVYKALELLTKNSFTDFDKNLNIFVEDGNVEVEFGFNNNTELIITSDLEKIPNNFNFLNGLSIFSPMLDYKKLLNVHYATTINGDRINLYGMLRQLLGEYPIGDSENKRVLSEIEDLPEYFKLLEGILKNDFQDAINNFLEKYFKSDIQIDKFEFKTKIDKNIGTATPVVNITIDYKEHIVEKYHTFLNEARLSALAISIYFVAIKKLLDKLEHDSLKMLVLDDLLISLDMSNRLK